MTSERIKEIQLETAYPDSASVKKALLQVWNECEQEQNKAHIEKIQQLEAVIAELKNTVNPFMGENLAASEEIIKTCEMKRDYNYCDIWKMADRGCGDCEFYLPLNGKNNGPTR